MPEVEAPEVEVDEDAPLFRRRLALAVVLITLFGAVVAYLHEQNSNLEDNAAREAQIASIKGFGQQVGASTEFRFDYRLFVQRQLLERRHVVAAARQRSTVDPTLGALYSNDSDRWTKVRDAIGDGAAVQDLQGADTVNSKLQATPDRARLTQEVFSNKANDYGNKADAFVALLTVLAVGLFLIGLSLTVSGRGRYLLATPGVAIAIVCLGWAVIITTSSVTKVSNNAIDLTAQGQELQSSGDPTAAIEKYQAAIKDSPDFGAAFARLADAEFIAGGKALAGNQFQSIADPEATKRAVAAGEKAISLGEGNASLLSDIGFYHFTLGEYDRAESLSQQALDSNDQFPPLVFNLGVVQVAKGDASAAEATYKRGIDLLAKEKDDDLRLQIIAAARTDLEIAESNTPSIKDLAQKMKGLLALAEAPSLDHTDKAPEGAPSGASVDNVAIKTDRFRLFASYDTHGFDTSTVLTNVWYFRSLDANGQGPFEQMYPMDQVAFPSDHVTTIPVENGDCLPGGDYRVEVYAGHDLMATADQHVPDSPLGTLVVAGGEDAGFTLCHPDTWTAVDLTGQPGSLAFTNPDNKAESVVAMTFPVGSATGNDPATFLNTFIGNVLQQQQLQVIGSPQSGQEFLGRTVENADVTLDTTTITATDGRGDFARITGSAGTDGVVRVVIVSANNADRLDVLRGELVNSVRFLRVPNASQ